MLTIGCHLSSSKGYLAMGKEAVSIGANTFQFFTRNPRGSKAKAIDRILAGQPISMWLIIKMKSDHWIVTLII